jgi:hypothetical protein
MHPIDKAARVAGAFYLAEVLIGPFSLIYVPNKLFVTGNATATANNILAHETLFRFGIIGDLLNGVLGLFTVLALYQLLKVVDRNLAALMVVLGGAMVTPIFFVNSLNWVAALVLVHGADFLAAFTRPEQYALAMVFLRIHSQGNVVNEIFWGLWLLPFGLLVMRSGFLPRFLGIWLMVGGVAYVINSFTGLLFPHYQDLVFTISQPAILSEIAIMLWLLIKGANVKALPATAPYPR